MVMKKFSPERNENLHGKNKFKHLFTKVFFNIEQNICFKVWLQHDS